MLKLLVGAIAGDRNPFLFFHLVKVVVSSPVPTWDEPWSKRGMEFPFLVLDHGELATHTAREF